MMMKNPRENEKQDKADRRGKEGRNEEKIQRKRIGEQGSERDRARGSEPGATGSGVWLTQSVGTPATQKLTHQFHFCLLWQQFTVTWCTRGEEFI